DHQLVIRSLRALLQPAQERLRFGRIRREPLAPAVGDLCRRLQEDQALFGMRFVDPLTVRVLDDLLPIEGGIPATERLLEPALAALRAVTRSLIAARFGEDRHDIRSEMNWPLAYGCLPGDRRRRRGRFLGRDGWL